MRQFALHRQQPEKDKQNFNFAPLEKFLRTPMAVPVEQLFASFALNWLHLINNHSKATSSEASHILSKIQQKLCADVRKGALHNFNL